uniref:Peroxisomal biogenesis factor 19 n=1 Tax=Cyanoderma ruficeps TaxID=181631 RepID=A0A8C3NYF8_9PASS
MYKSLGCSFGVPFWAAVTGVPLAVETTGVQLLGCSYWSAILGCSYWSAIRSRNPRGAVFGVQVLGCSFWGPLLPYTFHPPSLAAHALPRGLQTPLPPFPQPLFWGPLTPRFPPPGALDDFERSRPSPPPPAGSSSPPSPSPPSADSAKGSLFSSQERFFQELFEGELAAQAAQEFQEAMQELARQEPQLVEQFQKLSEAAGKVGSDSASQQEFTSCLKETLSGLAKNANDLQNSPGSEEELAKALEGLGLEEGGGDGVLPVMRSIMESLLSKDVLYPSLKEITEKYPEWLRQHEGSLSPEQRERFRAQQGLKGLGSEAGIWGWDLGFPGGIWGIPRCPHYPLSVP